MPSSEWWTLYATGVGLGGAGLGWVLREVRSLRHATVAGQSRIATLTADWLDEQDDHTDLQDALTADLGVRMTVVEAHLGLPPGKPVAVRRARRGPRRLDVLAAGLEPWPPSHQSEVSAELGMISPDEPDDDGTGSTRNLT